MYTMNSQNNNKTQKHTTGKISIKDKNLILDLDETLVHTYNDYHNLDLLLDEYMSKKTRPYIVDAPFIHNDEIINGRLWGSTRPHLDKFLRYCFKNFNQIIIWSAGTARYVKETVKHIFSRIRSPDYIFTRKDCLKVGDGVTKPIEHLAKNNPELGLTLANTLIIDDQITNFDHNPKNGILIPEFTPPLFDQTKNKENFIKTHDSDNNLLKLMTWFDQSGIMKVDDVRKINKNNIF